MMACTVVVFPTLSNLKLWGRESGTIDRTLSSYAAGSSLPSKLQSRAGCASKLCVPIPCLNTSGISKKIEAALRIQISISGEDPTEQLRSLSLLVFHIRFHPR